MGDVVVAMKSSMSFDGGIGASGGHRFCPSLGEFVVPSSVLMGWVVSTRLGRQWTFWMQRCSMTACWLRTWWRQKCVGARYHPCHARVWPNPAVVTFGTGCARQFCLICVVLNTSTTSSFHFWNLVAECLYSTFYMITIINIEVDDVRIIHDPGANSRCLGDVLFVCVLRWGPSNHPNFSFLNMFDRETLVNTHMLPPFYSLMQSQGFSAASQGIAWNRP
jgi:hypothetical protein